MSSPFLLDVKELKPGLIIFRRSDLRHENWYCRVRVPETPRYKTIALRTPRIREATEKAFYYDANIRLRRTHKVPVLDKPPTDRAGREEFTATEYQKLHRVARPWIEESQSATVRWYRTMAYNFMLIMTNTGMRTSEARKLKWRDVDTGRRCKDGRPFVTMSVRGEDGYRTLVAAQNVATYLQRIQDISRAIKADDFVFSTIAGEQNRNLYAVLIESLLKYAGLQISSSGSRRTTYCFRHTYATFRLMEGTDIHLLAKQMGTSAKVIDDYYGHVVPEASRERLLADVSEWGAVEAADVEDDSGTSGGPSKRKVARRTERGASRPGRPPESRADGSSRREGYRTGDEEDDDAA